MRLRHARRFHLATAFPEWRPLDFFHHEILHASRKAGSRARVGRLHTPHGTVETPGFVVVGTNGAVKFVDHHAADAAGMELMFSNTLHLEVHPGPAAVEAAGGLHKFIGRESRPLITDSGGFQIFSFAHRGQRAMPGAEEAKEDGEDGGASLKSSRPFPARHKYEVAAASSSRDGPPPPPRVRVSEDGASFRSYRDGRMLHLSPESTVRSQKALGADIIIPLDDLPGASTAAAPLEESVARTHRWEARSLREHLGDVRQQAMYGVIHGGTDERLRSLSVATLARWPFDGFCVGGSLGRDRSELAALLRYVMPLLPRERPNHLLGIGDVESIQVGVRLGVDTFDSCWPTRLGRHGTALTRHGSLKVGQARYRDDYGPLDASCDGFVSMHHSRAYLHHLWRAKEPAVHGLLTLHNIKFMADLMADMRAKIWRDEL